jgi:hypothetical protein
MSPSTHQKPILETMPDLIVEKSFLIGREILAEVPID